MTTPTACVYFVQMGDDGLIKIGTSRGLASRIRALQKESPSPLRLLGTVHGARPVEAAWHKRFHHLRQHGEWFHPGTELLAAIASERTAQPLMPTPGPRPKRPLPAPDFYRVSDVAKALHVDEAAVRSLCTRGVLATVRIGRLLRIYRPVLETYQAGLTPIALPTRGRPRHPAAPAAPREGAR